MFQRNGTFYSFNVLKPSLSTISIMASSKIPIPSMEREAQGPFGTRYGAICSKPLVTEVTSSIVAFCN